MSDTELQLAASTPGSGLGRQLRLVASSKLLHVLINYLINVAFRELANDSVSSDIKVYMTGDGSDVYEDSFMNICKGDGQTFVPTLILVGTRLGIEKVTPAYYDALAALLQMPQSIGIAG